MQRRNCIWAESFDPGRMDDGEPEIIPKTPEEEDRIWKCLKNIFLFKSVSSEDLEKLIGAMEKVSFERGDVVVRQGDVGDFLYVVDSGLFQAVKEYEDGSTRVLQTYDGAGHFGELALMHDTPGLSTVLAVSEGCLWALNRHTFRKTVLGGAHKKSELFEALLSKVSFLGKLTEIEKSRLADALLEVSYAEGEKIISEGDGADCMFFVLSGEVRLSKEGSGEEIELTRINTGEHFGEQAFLARGPRPASAYALGRVHLAKLDVGAFERLMGPCRSLVESGMVGQQLAELQGPTLNLTALKE